MIRFPNKRTALNLLFKLSIDILVINVAILAAYYINNMGSITNITYSIHLNEVILVTLIYIIVFYLFGLYKILWRFASSRDRLSTLISTIIGTLIIYNYALLNHSELHPTYFVTLWMIVFISKNCINLIYKLKQQNLLFPSKFKNYKNILIIGAGQAGSMVIEELLANPEMKKKPVAVIDDCDWKYGTKIKGVSVVGNRDKIVEIVKQKEIDEIIFAIPSAPKLESKKILSICATTKCKLKTLPDIHNLIKDDVVLKSVRDVNISDLLGRDEVNLNHIEDVTYLKDQVVLVTGGGGSIGSELCRQVAEMGIQKLIVLDIYENNAYELQQELLRKHKGKFELTVAIASVQDEAMINEIFKKCRPNIVFHAAAHKHVPLMEDSPKEAIKNNIFGTYNVAKISAKYHVDKFILISTDKAVNPTNVMGATKRVAEMTIQSLNKKYTTKFASVRFGNVLGSNGSVIPLFMKQIQEGGPVTITHPEITRFFMTINEAVQLVIQAGAITGGGEIFILDMGTPTKIVDLAKNLITLSGYEPDKDIKIVCTGLRPGEKLYEELMLQEEGILSTKYKKIFVANPAEFEFTEFTFELEFIQKLLNNSDFDAFQELERIVPNYKRTENVYAVIAN